MNYIQSLNQFYHINAESVKAELEKSAEFIENLFLQEISNCLHYSHLVIEDDMKVSFSPHMIKLIESINKLKELKQAVDDKQFNSLIKE